jgi:DNA-binding transcriptional regulator YiaG
MKPQEIKTLRGKLTQKAFAFALYELSRELFPGSKTMALSTLRDWEQGRYKPDTWGAYLLYKYKNTDG